MRVSQIIKEAIKNNVEAKAEVKIASIDEAIKLEREALEKNYSFDAVKAQCEEILEKYFNFLLSQNVSIESAYGTNISDAKTFGRKFGPDFYHQRLNNETIKALEKDKREIKEKAQKTINDIILQLELGTNKDTVNDLLNQVSF